MVSWCECQESSTVKRFYSIQGLVYALRDFLAIGSY
jgi:hypothetical protein